MGRLVVTQNITVDGRIEFLDDWFQPSPDSGYDDLQEEMDRQGSATAAMLLGRQTFEDFRGYWPGQTDDRTGVTDVLNRVHKYVVSSTLTDAGWQNSTILSGDWLDQVAQLKQQPGKDIGVTGSIRLCHALIRAGLVDEYRLFVYPAVQGRGRRLFPDGFELPRLETVESTAFRSGVTLLRYAVR